MSSNYRPDRYRIVGKVLAHLFTSESQLFLSECVKPNLPYHIKFFSHQTTALTYAVATFLI